MKILVDDKRQDMRPLPKTMGNLIADLRTAVTNAGRIVLTISVDGRELSEDEERKIAAEPIARFGAVAVTTSEPKALCLSILEEVGRHIQPIIDECDRIASLIDAGKEMPALERILPCIEVWGTILATVQKVSGLMQVNINEVSTDQEALSDSGHRPRAAPPVAQDLDRLSRHGVGQGRDEVRDARDRQAHIRTDPRALRGDFGEVTMDPLEGNLLTLAVVDAPLVDAAAQMARPGARQGSFRRPRAPHRRDTPRGRQEHPPALALRPGRGGRRLREVRPTRRR